MNKKIILLHITFLVLLGCASQYGGSPAVRPSYARENPEKLLTATSSSTDASKTSTVSSPRGPQKATPVVHSGRKKAKPLEESVEDTCVPEEFENLLKKHNANPYEDLNDLAEKYLGSRYRAGGTDEKKGFDCSGFVWRVFSDLGFSDFPRAASSSVYMGGQAVDRKELQKGDLCFFNTSGRGVSHVGIMLDSTTFVHSSTSDGVIYTNIEEDPYWRSRIVGFRRYTFQ